MLHSFNSLLTLTTMALCLASMSLSSVQAATIPSRPVTLDKRDIMNLKTRAPADGSSDSLFGPISNIVTNAMSGNFKGLFDSIGKTVDGAKTDRAKDEAAGVTPEQLRAKKQSASSSDQKIATVPNATTPASTTPKTPTTPKVAAPVAAPAVAARGLRRRVKVSGEAI